MKAYEGMIILDPVMKKEDMDALILEIEGEISKNQGKIEELQRMGRRRLEHPIGRHPEGYFLVIHFHAEPQTIKKMSVKFHLKESILRFFFVDRKDGFVKFKSFDENAPVQEGYSQGYSHGAPQESSARPTGG